ncbi:hypothetical protein GOODEAATRI_015322, partial [Goodea atripinnis]
MSLAIRFWTLVVNMLCIPMHVINAVGLYKVYKRVFPMILRSFSASYNQIMHERKVELFRSLSEFTKPGGKLTILEIGCGTGTNFQFYPPGCKVICTDPNPHFQKYLEESMKKNEQLTFDRFVVTSGEDMASVGDESVDVVVCTLVLCTVRDIPQTLREVFLRKMQCCLMKFCRLVCLALSTPFYLMQFFGLRGMYKRLFPFLAYNITFSYNDKMHELKRELFRNLARFTNADGTLRLLEIGCGSGANFRFYPNGCTVICTDPNPHMEPYLRMSMDVNKHLSYEEILVLSGEDLREVQDESVDVVVCTLVLCSVNNVENVLQEARRVLRNVSCIVLPSRVVGYTATSRTRTFHLNSWARKEEDYLLTDVAVILFTVMHFAFHLSIKARFAKGHFEEKESHSMIH